MDLCGGGIFSLLNLRCWDGGPGATRYIINFLDEPEVPKNYKDGLSNGIMKPLFKSRGDPMIGRAEKRARVFFAIRSKSCYFF